MHHVHELLRDVVDEPESRAYVLDRKLIADEVGVRGVPELRAWMDELDPQQLVGHFIGGVTVNELLPDFRDWAMQAYTSTDFVLAPLPDRLFTRDSSAWIHGGVTINPMARPARRRESIHPGHVWREPLQA